MLEDGSHRASKQAVSVLDFLTVESQGITAEEFVEELRLLSFVC